VLHKCQLLRQLLHLICQVRVFCPCVVHHRSMASRVTSTWVVVCVCDFAVFIASAIGTGPPLPAGWGFAYDPQGRVYFLNHKVCVCCCCCSRLMLQ